MRGQEGGRLLPLLPWRSHSRIPSGSGHYAQAVCEQPRLGETTVLFPQWAGKLQQEQKCLEDALGAEATVKGREALGQGTTSGQPEGESSLGDCPA